MSDPTAEDPLLEAAAGGALVLTATRRLARHLRKCFDHRQAALGRRSWPTPAIHSGDSWLLQAVEKVGEGWRLLGKHPSRRLWEQIIEGGDSGSQQLLQVGSTARLAAEAHALCCEYEGDPATHLLTADHESFLRWRSAYSEVCLKGGWIDAAALPEHVIEKLKGGGLSVPSDLWFVGFDELPPRFRRLGEAFSRQGSAVREFPPARDPMGQRVRVPCADARDEVRRAARWVRRLMEEGEGEIGIVVPELEKYRTLIERIFREEIDPAAQVRPGSEEVRFNLSLGSPLASQGAVVSALEILSVGGFLPLGQAGFLLRTPYLAGALRERYARARLDRRLRAAGEPLVSLKHLRSLAGEAVPQFAAILDLLLASAVDREKRLPGSWAGRFAGTLKSAGWPGERPLDSVDYQVVKGWWEKVFPQMASFDAVSGPVSRSEALALLRRLAAESDFQLEGPESPVQVVGLLECAGLRFRHLWVMGLHDGALPAPPRPNPFLPIRLQIDAGMPHADPQREGHFARRVADRLFAAAPFVILSHPEREGDTSLLPSPLIRDLPLAEIPLSPSSAPAVLWRNAPPAVEMLPDPLAPPLAEGEGPGGGTALLKDQALCPFRAFARHRLKAAALEVPDIGLDPRQKGSLLHKVMEIFWHRTRSHEALLALGEEGVRLRVSECIEMGVETLFPVGNNSSASPLLALEKERLRHLVCEWLLNVEVHRGPFTVMEEEALSTGNYGGVEIVTRIDRVDRLPDGRLVVLDYKTGQVDAGDLVGDRLTEPQLPVYGLGKGEGLLAGVAFASLRRGKSAFCGVGESEGLLPKVPAVSGWKKAREEGIGGWDELLARWKGQLSELGRSFAAGEAVVDPVSPEKACRFCDLVPLCRILEKEPFARGEEE